MSAGSSFADATNKAWPLTIPSAEIIEKQRRINVVFILFCKKEKIIVRILPYIKHTQMLLFFLLKTSIWGGTITMSSEEDMNGQQDRENMFNGTKYQKNATRNTEKPLHSC